jgi:hypothetical protein
MGEKLVVGPVNRGLRNDIPPFMIDNDSFPTLTNAYQWRSRLRRKRGTSFLARLTRYFDSTISSYNPGGITTITLDGSGNGNLLFNAAWILETNSALVQGSIMITDTSNADELYTDPAGNGILVGSTGGTGTINYATGAFNIAGGAGHVITATFNYYPDLPVMGLEDFVSVLTEYPGTLGFDTTYAYNFLTAFPYTTYSVSFFKNPPTATYPGYVAKATPTPLTWNGQNYQQFWTTNYQGSLWATNGITVPFSTTNIGMQFQKPTSITWVNATTLDFVIAASPLIVGDFVFTNEFTSTTPANAILMNMLTGYVTAVNTGTSTYTVVFPNAAIPSDTYSNGILQYLTTRVNTTIDCIRWYDGDPTSGNPTVPALTGHLGWVNFCPPLSNFNVGTYSVADLPAATYYLVGGRMIYPFKDRLIVFAPVVQTSSPGSQVYLKDTIIYSQNGTAYYTSTFTADPSLSTTVFFPVLVPASQTATANAWWENQTGFGGYLTAGNDQDIISLGVNEDVLIVQFSRSMTRLISTGNDTLPFGFFSINAEWGTVGTFSSITMDQGVISIGNRGLVVTGQTTSQRIDLEIPDNIFEIGLQNNGAERICAQRDFINEWIYFTYVPDIEDDEAETTDIFPSQTLQYNYRAQSWAIFNESYTTYGTFRKLAGFTWATVGFEFPTWIEWNEPWNAGVASQLQPEVIGGTSQGFVIIRDQATAESISRFIQNISGILVTSPGHALDNGDYIIISGCIGTVSSQVNQKIFGVQYVSQDQFNLIPTTPLSSGLTYLGGGVITKMYVPFIQTKQFPLAWGNARKTRLGPQQYLITKTANSQITLLIYLSTDATTPYNYIGFPLAANNIVPEANSTNDSLVYSATLYTCPESINLGLTPANINLQMLTAISQNQIWHRMNTSLIGDTVQIGFSLSDAQMRSLDPIGMPIAITGATQTYPCILTASGSPAANQLVYITGVVGMTQLNSSPNATPPAFNYFNIISSNATTITIDVDATGFSPYISGGSLQIVGPQNQFAEIEIMGFILDVQPSQLLA